MKKLKQFFAWEDFIKDKVLMSTGQSEWKDYKTGAHLGTKVEAAIIEDNTVYADPGVTNLFEKLTFKLRKDDINVPIGVEIQAMGVKASICGDFSDKLSCTAEDIIFKPPKD